MLLGGKNMTEIERLKKDNLLLKKKIEDMEIRMSVDMHIKYELAIKRLTKQVEEYRAAYSNAERKRALMAETLAIETARSAALRKTTRKLRAYVRAL